MRFFTKREDTRLRRLFKAKWSSRRIGKAMGRNKSSINQRLKLLGLRGTKKTPSYSYAYRTPADIEYLRSLR